MEELEQAIADTNKQSLVVASTLIAWPAGRAIVNAALQVAKARRSVVNNGNDINAVLQTITDAIAAGDHSTDPAKLE